MFRPIDIACNRHYIECIETNKGRRTINEITFNMTHDELSDRMIKCVYDVFKHCIEYDLREGDAIEEIADAMNAFIRDNAQK